MAGQLYGIRGWLIFPAIGAVLTPISLLVILTRDYFSLPNWELIQSDAPLLWFVVLVFSMHVLLLVFSLDYALAFFNKESFVPKYFWILHISAIFSVLIRELYQVVLLDVAFPSDVRTVIRVGLALLMTATWGSYLMTSKRCKNTFTRSHFSLMAFLWNAVFVVPTSANDYLKQADEWFGRHNYDRAIACYSKAIQLDPSSSINYFLRGLAFNMKNDFDRAIMNYDEAIRLNPSSPTAYASRGTAWRIKKNYEQAYADFDQAIRLGKQDFSIYSDLAQLCFECGKYEEAILNIDRAIGFIDRDVIDPFWKGVRSSLLYVRRGEALIALGNTGRAIADFSEAIKRGDFHDHYYSRGLAFEQLNELSLALSDFQTAKSKFPQTSNNYEDAIMRVQKKLSEQTG